jgi:hypothetical protein
MSIVSIISIIGAIALYVLVIDFVRRNLLKEKYSVLWLTLSVVVMVLAIWNQLLDKLASFVGVAYAPSLLFFVAFLFVLLILLHFSVVVSILYDRNKALIQELALLKSSLEDERRPGEGRPEKRG